MTSGVVRVFSVDLDQSAAVVSRLDQMLAPGERNVSTHVRVARAATRVVLGNVLGIAAETVPISRVCSHCGHPTHGRPTVAGNDEISFSLSHSGAFAVVALAGGGARVGADVEAVRPRARLAALAARVLNDDEHAAWLATPEGERLHAFLRAWTAKEAYLKALGIGIATPLREVPAHVDGWLTRPLDVGDQRVGALAVDRPELAIEYAPLFSAATSSGGTAG